jgi:hypothetical protein
MENRILVVDINLLTIEDKALERSALESMLISKYGCKILLVDNSKSNTTGAFTEKTGIYFIS